MENVPDHSKNPGPDPEYLKSDLSFEEAADRLLNTPKPDGWDEEGEDEDEGDQEQAPEPQNGVSGDGKSGDTTQ